LDELGCEFGVHLPETHFIAEPVLIVFVHLKNEPHAQKLGNVVRCGAADFACFDNKHFAISTTPMALSLTMDFAPCSNALRFTALCVHFVLFTMGFTRPCARQRKKKTWKPGLC